MPSCKQLYLGLKFAVSYFSILPIPFKSSDNFSEPNVLATMLFFLPLVGFILGIGTVVLFSFLEPLGWYGALVAAVSYMALYGFLHTEAVMDVADALYAAHSGKDAYAIIKEPTVGAMGVLYAMGLILLKVAGSLYLLTHHLFMEFISVLIISRLSLLMLFKIHTFKSSFATQLKNALSKGYLITSFLLFSLIGSFLTPYFIVILIQGVVLALIISWIIKSKIGFVNGDVLGATLEGVETLLFIGIARFML